MNLIKQINNEVNSLNEETEKFYGKKNKAAGARVRKHAMNIKHLVSELRKDVTEVKNSF